MKELERKIFKLDSAIDSFLLELVPTDIAETMMELKRQIQAWYFNIKAEDPYDGYTGEGTRRLPG